MTDGLYATHRPSRLTHALAVLGGLLLVAACTETRVRPDLPDAPPDAAEPQPYVIKVGDSLGVRFYKTPELNIDAPVRSDGKISVPPIGDVQAAGRKPAELATALSEAFARELTNPKVTVMVLNFGGTVYVTGLVKSPHGTPFTSGLTALQAIATAGGFDDKAALNSVILVRREGGEHHGYRLALDRVMSGEEMAADVPLQPEDILYVPRSWIGDVDLWVDQFIRQLLPPTPPILF